MSKPKDKGRYGENKAVKLFRSLGLKSTRLANNIFIEFNGIRTNPDIIVEDAPVELKQVAADANIPNPVRILLYGKRYNYAVIVYVDNEDGFITLRLKDFTKKMPISIWREESKISEIKVS